MASEVEVQNGVAFIHEDPTGNRLVSWAKAASAANALAKSLTQTDFVPATMKDVNNATAAIIMGDELGFSPLAALRSIYVVHGTPALYARSMVALILSQGHEIWTESSTPEKVVVRGRRKGSDHSEESIWTTARASKAGYTSNKKYQTNPEEMLFSKASAEICRKIGADVLLAIPYSVEDLELQEEPLTVTLTREPQTIKRAVKEKPSVEEPELEEEVVAPVIAIASSTVTWGQDEPELDEPEPTGSAVDDWGVPLVAIATPVPTPSDLASTKQVGMIGALMTQLGLTDRDVAINYVQEVIGREIASRTELTKREASKVIDALNADKAGK